MRIDQVVASAAPGDSVTRFALRLRAGLVATAEAEVFALHVDPALAGDVRELGELDALGADRRIVHHLSAGSADVASALVAAGGALIVEHHGRTPPLPGGFPGALAGRTSLAIADSARSAEQLAEAGCRDVQIATPVTRTDALLATEPHEPTEHHLETVVHGPVLLYVGEVVPPERLDRLVAAFNVLVSHHRPDVHLVVAGTGGSEVYANALRRQLLELNLANVWLIESVSEPELVAFLRRADLLVTMSEDERFWEPMVDAFAFGVPVVARRIGSQSDVAGDGALLLDAGDGIEVAAEAFLEVLTNDRLRSRLVARGSERAALFDPDVAVRRHLELITGGL